LYHLDAIDFGRRMAVEKEIEKTENVPQPNAVFDESSNFLIYATLLGIKVCLSSFIFSFSLYIWFLM
jgi:peptidylprolyl isomerase domain and WD repeat-containing protein 1